MPTPAHGAGTFQFIYFFSSFWGQFGPNCTTFLLAGMPLLSSSVRLAAMLLVACIDVVSTRRCATPTRDASLLLPCKLARPLRLLLHYFPIILSFEPSYAPFKHYFQVNCTPRAAARQLMASVRAWPRWVRCGHLSGSTTCPRAPSSGLPPPSTLAA